MIGAGLLVMTVAAINLALLRLAGLLWDVITVEHDQSRMTEMIGIFLGLVIVQGLCSVGHSYLTAWISQHVVADFRTHLFSHLHTLSISFFNRRRASSSSLPGPRSRRVASALSVEPPKKVRSTCCSAAPRR